MSVKSMSRLVVLLLAITLVLATAGCGSKKEDSSNQKPAPQQATEQKAPAPEQKAPAAKSKLGDIYFTGATQGGGGTWDMMGNGISKIITQKVPGSRVTLVPGEGLATTIAISKAEADIGLIVSAAAAAGAKGQDPYKEKLDQVRAIGSLYYAPKQFLVLADFPLNSLEEIAQKKPKMRIAVGDAGSFIEYTSRKLLAEVGVTYKDIESWGGKVFYKSMGDAADMLSDGLLDAVLISGSTPIGSMQEAAVTKKLKMIQFGEQTIKAMIDKHGYSTAVIPKGSYTFVANDMPTFAHRTVLGAGAGLPEDDVYKMTQALGDSLTELRAIHANMKTLELKFMAEGTGVPLHPGAIKYYKEKGTIK